MPIQFGSPASYGAARFDRWPDIGMNEVVAFEEQRLVAILGKRIGEAVAKVQLRLLSASLAKVAIGLARDTGLRLGDRLDDDPGVAYEIVNPPAPADIPEAVEDNRQLQIAPRGKSRCLT